MTAIATNRITRFYQTSVGKKVVMAVTGIILFGFLIVHMIGNLQVFSIDHQKINAYSELLHHSPALLWTARSILIIALAMHVASVVQLYRTRARARPIRYAKKGNRGASIPSLIMLWSGIAIGLFVVCHILHMTTGTLHNDFRDTAAGTPDVFHNLTAAFVIPLVAIAYVIAMALLAFHLYHGLYSMTQSLGLSHPRYAGRAKQLAIVIAVVLSLGFAAIPIAILAHLVA